MINFTVTFQGLQDQLLSTVLSHEVPHLESQRYQLLESISLDAMTLEELEEKALTVLQNAQGKLPSDIGRPLQTFAKDAIKVIRTVF